MAGGLKREGGPSVLDPNSAQAAAARLAAQSDAVARLAKDSGAFAATVAAFEAEDGEAVRWILDRLELYPFCELICEWLRIKLCVLRCIEVCGPPRIEDELPSLQDFARELAQLGRRDGLLRDLVDAVDCGAGEAYHALLAEHGLDRFCHLICRWICSVRYERICRLVCSPIYEPPIDAATVAVAEARSLEKLASGDTLKRLSDAVLVLNCVEAQSSLNNAGFQGECEIICRVICVWRMSWVCRELCLRPPVVLTGVLATEEAREFALASRALAAQPRLAATLVDAVARNDAQAFGGSIARLGLEPYCLQVCSWVGSLICFEFCLCVCPNPTVQAPEWTNIGYILVASDIDATGKTTVARSGAGGVGYAFYNSLQLTGFCAATSSITPGSPMMYRFVYSLNGGPLQPVVDGMLNPAPFQVAGLPTQLWPSELGGKATATDIPTPGGAVFVCNSGDVPFPVTTPPAIRPAPGVGDTWYPPQVYVWPDAATGWTLVFQDTYAGFVTGFMDLNSETIAAGSDPNVGFALADIGAPIPASATLNGSNVTFTFEATRVSTPSPPDYQQTPVLTRVNNNDEVNQLYFKQFFGTEGCCTPISDDLTVLFSVDHEEMGPWSLVISSCALTSPITLWPTGTPPATVTIDARGGYGFFDQSTTGFPACSYTVTLTTTPLLTTGIVNWPSDPHPLTFCICGP
jgi:hypothetical protein